MHFDGEIAEQFEDFVTIYETVTQHDYPDEQKAEMVELLKGQTVEKHLNLIKASQKLGADLGELSDKVWVVVQGRGKGKFCCQELFLQLFDSALEECETFSSERPNLYIEPSSPVKVQRVRVDEDLKRKMDQLLDENKVLKEELEEKMAILDKLSEVDRKFRNLKSEFSRMQEKCEFLDSENKILKVQVKDINNDLVVKETEFRRREQILLCELKDIKETVVDKETLLKLSENERGFMFTDFELLSEEIVDRDLVIQTLSDTKNIHDTFIPAAARISFKEGDLNSPAKKEAGKCENCSRRRESSVYFSQLNSTIPRRLATPSPLLDDSLSPMPDEVDDFSERRSKSLSDELMEVKMGMESERTSALKEIVSRLMFLEIELKSRRQNLEKSVKLLLKKRKPNPKLMIRYRVTKGKLSKMEFTRHRGIILPN